MSHFSMSGTMLALAAVVFASEIITKTQQQRRIGLITIGAGIAFMVNMDLGICTET